MALSINWGLLSTGVLVILRALRFKIYTRAPHISKLPSSSGPASLHQYSRSFKQSFIKESAPHQIAVLTVVEGISLSSRLCKLWVMDPHSEHSYSIIICFKIKCTSK